MPPKRKKKLGRNPKVDHKKWSTYDYSAARDIIGLPAANFRQITLHALQSGPNPPSPNSPAKKEYEDMLEAEESMLHDLLSKNQQLQKSIEAGNKKLPSLKAAKQQLATALWEERKKSQLVIAQLLEEAETIMAEAYNIQLSSDFNASLAKEWTEETVVLNRKTAEETVQEERWRSKETTVDVGF